MTDTDAGPAEAAPKKEGKGKGKSAVKAAEEAPPAPSGPRHRKQAEIYKIEASEKEEFVIKSGKGKKLSEIPNVHFLLGKVKGDDELLVQLHTLLYKRPGKAHRRKKDIYEFSGFVFPEGDEEKELEKIRDRLSKWTVQMLHSALDVFELPRGSGDEGKKEAKVERLLKFLEKPKKLSDKDLAAADAKKKGKTSKRAASGSAKKEPAKKAKKEETKKRKKAESEEEESSESEEAEEEAEEEKKVEEAEEEEEEEKKEEEPPKKKAKKEKEEKKPAPKKEKAEKAKPAPKKEKAEKKEKEEKKPARGKAKAEKKAKEADEDEDDKPLAGGPPEEKPSDEDLREAVLNMLKGVDVNSMTMKQLMAKLSASFKVDLAPRKALIKEVAVEFAKSQKAPEKEGEEEAAQDEDKEEDNEEVAETDGEKKEAAEEEEKEEKAGDAEEEKEESGAADKAEGEGTSA